MMWGVRYIGGMTHHAIWHHKTWLVAELLLLFAVLPVVLSYYSLKGVLFITLWVLAIGCLIVWAKQTGGSIKSLVSFHHFSRERWRPMLLRFICCAVAMALFTATHDEGRLLQLPIEKPKLWMMIMVLYPILSVFPQEIIYRVFFFDRYASLFVNQRHMIFASAFAFGHAHFMFNNWVAYFMSVIGGLIFADTYARTRSLPLVWLEHALYGCFVFTIGLGWYFYTGNAHLHVNGG